MPTVISRSAWGAPAKSGGDDLPLSRVSRLFVHYTGSAADLQDNHANCASRVLGIYRFHTSPTPSDPTKPWADIAYSFVICRHGVIFEGRGLGKRTAATGPCNGDSYAICFLGNDTAGRRDVTPEAVDAFAWLIGDIERRKGAALDLRGHRDCMNTTCPGDELYALVRSGALRRQTTTEEEDMPLTDAEIDKIAARVWARELSYGGEQAAASLFLGRARKAAGYAMTGIQQLAAQGGVDVDEAAIAAALLEVLTPAQIATALSPQLARQVADELAKRLAA